MADEAVELPRTVDVRRDRPQAARPDHGQDPKLVDDQAALTAWIAEFAPQMHVNCEHDPESQDDRKSLVPFLCPDIRWNCCKAPGSGPHDSSCENGSITAPNSGGDQ